MPRVGPIYSLPPGYLAVDGTTIQVSQHNPPLEDIAQALTNSLASDGATPLTGNLQMNTNKITGLAAGTNPADAVRFDQVTDLTGLTATVAELNILDGIPPTLTATELGYVDGVTSAIQTQLDGKVAVIADPGADRLRGWDDSAGAEVYFTAGSGLVITDTTISAPGAPVLLATRTASGGATVTLDFTEFNNAVYSRYRFIVKMVKPLTDGVSLRMRTSTNGGAGYDSGASDYQYTVRGDAVGGGSTLNESAGSTTIALTNIGGSSVVIGNAAGEEGVTGEVTLYNVNSVAKARVIALLDADSSDGTGVRVYASGTRNTAQDTDAVRFLFSAGNIADGSTIEMWGLV